MKEHTSFQTQIPWLLGPLRVDAVLWENECINVPGNVTWSMESFETSAGILQTGEAAELASRDTLQGKSVFLGMGWGWGVQWLQACLLCLQAPCWHFFFQLELGFSLTCPPRRSEKQLLHLRVINLELRSQGYLVQQLVVWHLLGHLQWQQPRAYRVPPCRWDSPPLLRKGLWTHFWISG